MGVLDRAGNLLKGLLKKPLRALERTEEERMLERELEDKAALERARKNIAEMERAAEPAGRPTATPPPASPPVATSEKDANGRTKRRMGPE